MSDEAEYKKLKAKQGEIIYVQVDRESSTEKLSHSLEKLNSLFEVIKNLSRDNKREINYLKQIKEALESSQQLAAQALNDVTAADEIEAEKQKLYLIEKKAKMQAKEVELASVKEEFYSVKATMKKKQEMINEIQEEMKAETKLFEKKRKLLNKLTSRSEETAKDSKFLEEQKSLTSKLANLNDQISLEKSEIEAILKENSTISDEVAKMEAECSAKSSDVATLRSTVTANKKEITRVEEKGRRIANKIESSQQKEHDEIMRLEEQISELQISAKNLDEKCDDLNSEIGDSNSFDEKKLRSEVELAGFQPECAELENEIDAKNTEIISNEAKITEMTEIQRLQEEHLEEERLQEKRLREERLQEELLQQKRPNAEIVESTSENEAPRENQFKLPEVPLISRAQTDRARKRELAPPLATADRNLKTAKKTFKKRRSQKRKNLPIVRSADSSMWPSDSDMPEADNGTAERNAHALNLFKKHFM